MKNEYMLILVGKVLSGTSDKRISKGNGSTLFVCLYVTNTINILAWSQWENKNVFIMNDFVREKINNFVEHCPNYIDGVSNANDRHRLYDIIVAVRETNESVVDTKEELRNAITLSGKFLHAEHVIADCMTALDTIPLFLDYYLN